MSPVDSAGAGRASKAQVEEAGAGPKKPLHLSPGDPEEQRKLEKMGIQKGRKWPNIPRNGRI